MLISFLYTISSLSQTLELVRVPSDQNIRWRLSFLFSTDKGQESLFLSTHTIPNHSWSKKMIVATLHTCDNQLKQFSFWLKFVWVLYYIWIITCDLFEWGGMQALFTSFELPLFNYFLHAFAIESNLFSRFAFLGFLLQYC
jgi:small-conductance mechanosensitive channel